MSIMLVKLTANQLCKFLLWSLQIFNCSASHAILCLVLFSICRTEKIYITGTIYNLHPD